MNASEIRMINENQGTGRVYFHLKNGKTIERVMMPEEVQKAQVIRKKYGNEAFNKPVHLHNVSSCPYFRLPWY